MLMLCGVLAFAQSRLVTGRVTDNAGKPVPFASIVVKGTRTGVQTDVNGEYSIRVNSGDVLQISQASFDVVEVPVGTMSSLVTSLQQKNNTITEVIVTSAFNVRRTARSTASNVQNVSGEQLNTVRQSNVNNALAGKVAGVQVRSQSAGKLGTDETTIRLRGENGLNSGSGPIYVVDGTIIPSSGDINPDDIENISVLQGPSSAALFGPEGSNGAIVITTKRARRNQPGMGVEINSAITFDKVYIMPNYQNSYAGGSGKDMIQFEYLPGMPEGWRALDGKYFHNFDDDASWGPRMMGQEYIPWYSFYGGHERSFTTASLVPQPNNSKSFYNTGVTTQNNINFSKATENTSFRISYTNLDIKGLIPNSYLKKNTLNANLSIDVSKRFNITTNINYINQVRNSESNDDYSNASSGSFNQWFHRELDMDILRDLRGLKTPEGVYASWNIHTTPDAYDPSDPGDFYKGNFWYNPYTYFDLVKNYDNRDRLFGDITATYKLTNDFKIRGTYRKQQLTTNANNIYPTELEISGVQSTFNPYGESSAEQALAAYQTGQSSSNRQFYEGLLLYNKKVRDFSINATGGIVISKFNSRSFNANTSGGLSIPNVYSLANSVNKVRNNGFAQYETINRSTRRALFISGDLGYKNMVFVEGTYRKDYSSTEPQGNSIDTKSAGISLIFSELLPKNNILSFGKIRASAGQILNSLNAYDLNGYYAVSNNYGANPIMDEYNTLIDPSLKGAVNNEKEIGLELRFLKNRLGLTTTYWDRTNKGFPVTVNRPGTTGYTGLLTNAGEIAKNGIDIQLFLAPIRKENFTWDITATWGRILRNEVVSISPDSSVTRLISGGGSYTPFTGSTAGYAAWTVSEIGQPWGQLHGTGIKRIDGKPVLNPDGTFIAEQDVNFGSVLPKYTGGVQNSLTVFKNFMINVNIDYSWGGKFFSLSDYWGSYSGLTAKTAAVNDRGHSVRDAVEDGGGIHVFGVDETGKDYDVYMDAKDYYQQFPNSKISEKSVYDLSYVKMREFSIGYRLPMDRINIGKYIKSATFSVIARNPWLIYSKTKDFDPSEISGISGEDGQFPGTRSLGFNLKLGF